MYRCPDRLKVDFNDFGNAHNFLFRNRTRNKSYVMFSAKDQRNVFLYKYFVPLSQLNLCFPFDGPSTTAWQREYQQSQLQLAAKRIVVA